MKAAANASTGGVTEHAAGPHAVAASTSGHAHGYCLNCGATLIGKHCHVCGQSAHVHRTIGALGHDIAHGVFHFEGKAWRTLPMLALHPGQLTRRYVDGERARFVSPIAMFLFSVFLMFAIVAHLPLVHIGEGDFLKAGVASRAVETRLDLGKQRREAMADARETARDLAREKADAAPNRARIDRLTAQLSRQQMLSQQLATAAQALPSTSDDGPNVTFKGPNAGWLQEKWSHATANPTLLFYKVKSSAYKYSWALIPLSVPFLWLLFPFSRRFGLYDHAVFTTYSLTFMSLLATLAAVLLAAGLPWFLTVLPALIVAPIHIYKQLRGTYALGRIGAGMRLLVLLGFICWPIVPLFAVGLLYLGVD